MLDPYIQTFHESVVNQTLMSALGLLLYCDAQDLRYNLHLQSRNQEHVPVAPKVLSVFPDPYVFPQEQSAPL